MRGRSLRRMPPAWCTWPSSFVGCCFSRRTLLCPTKTPLRVCFRYSWPLGGSERLYSTAACLLRHAVMLLGFPGFLGKTRPNPLPFMSSRIRLLWSMWLSSPSPPTPSSTPTSRASWNAAVAVRSCDFHRTRVGLASDAQSAEPSGRRALESKTHGSFLIACADQPNRIVLGAPWRAISKMIKIDLAEVEHAADSA
jgi:hypothetical protein